MAKPLPHELHCLRCGYTWIRRGGVLPKHCSKCNNPYWNQAVKRFAYVPLTVEGFVEAARTHLSAKQQAKLRKLL